MSKQTRRCASKVRTGCKTCKIRRLKCGEELPHCVRCIKSGMTCDGYDVISRFITSGLQSVPIRPNPSVSLSLVLDEEETRYFQDFVHGRLVDSCVKPATFSRQFLITDAFFWAGIVLRESHATPAIRHATIAIAALVKSLYRHWEEGSHVKATKFKDPHHLFSLQQYQKALQTLRTTIAQPRDREESRSALVACLVLSFFDLLYGNRAFAAQHMTYGRSIVNYWRKQDKRVGFLLDPEPESVDSISRLFMRLDIQSLSLSGEPLGDSYADLDISELPMRLPVKFKNLNEARYIGQLLITKASNFRLQTIHLEHSNQPIPSEIADRRKYFMNTLRQFNIRVDRLLLDPVNHSTTNNHPLARTESLKAYTTATLMRLTSGWGIPQTACDSLEKEYRYIVSLGRSIIDFEAKTTWATNSSKPNSSSYDQTRICFEYRHLPFLFLVGSKCRDPILRREAIRLMLSCHWREGIWDSYLGGKMATWIMKMEEMGMDENGFIPEHARCYGETFSMGMATRIAEVRCWQNTAGGGRVERKTEIAW